ncbi:MAG: ribosome silencing factor [Bacillota bacterium]|nr:ribosome silencing factor [Bacillota bacterium]
MNEKDLVSKLLDEHKAYDINVYEVSDITPFASYYVVASCLNLRALGAMAEILEDELLKAGVVDIKKDGKPESGWMVIATGEVMVQLFLDAQRREYRLEELLQKQLGTGQA